MKYLLPHTPLFPQKFVSTTIRPTLMPYTELYNWDSCAQFVADFLSMEPLADPLKPVSATLGCMARPHPAREASDGKPGKGGEKDSAQEWVWGGWGQGPERGSRLPGVTQQAWSSGSHRSASLASLCLRAFPP